MDQINHSYIQVNGLKLHVAEIGSDQSPVVVFLHGFPEIWYTWRHQLIAVAKAGFRAIAPDYRGYGLSDIPTQPEKTRGGTTGGSGGSADPPAGIVFLIRFLIPPLEKTEFVDFANDIASILDHLAISKVLVIGKDFGSMVGYTFSLYYPEKVTGIITLGLPFLPPGSHQGYLALPEGFYIRRWQEVGRAEADFGRFDAKTVVKNIYILFSKSEVPIANENQEVMDLVDPSSPLPSWFTEEDLKVYGDLYHKSGFDTPLQVPYRTLADKTVYPPHRLNDLKVDTPAMLIIGEEDYVIKFPGVEEYVKSGEVKKFVPKLEVVNVPKGCHFVHEQFPDQVNQLVMDFLNSNKD
ncbi:hypothetical protein QVD17_21406 [Tagetes erecta]|uniref:AB hydrolase-1 domain-containing protein n=1 Tax=Tagetes erecta TaxID=13708 RepID=A0AAD8KFE6_TARER|nr:hypothetical protein QVD17_21406 [Tagetes erecta]